jgi:hypothetical protein
MKLAASALITVTLVSLLRNAGMKFIPDAGCFAAVRWWTLPLYLVTLIGMNYFRATRWRYLLRSVADVPRRKLVAVSWIGFAAILLMPFRIGEFVRPYMLRSAGKTDASGKTVGAITVSTATGSVVAERVVDGLYLSLVLLVALLTVPTVSPLPDTVVGLHIPVERVRQAGFSMPILFGVAMIVIAVFYWARAFAHRATLAVFGIVSKPLAERLAKMAENLADGLHFLGKPRDAIPFLWETTLYWGLNALGMWILAWGSGVTHADGSIVTYGEACALMGMLGISILIPGPPGMLGPFQLGIYAGMTMYFPTHTVVTEGAAYVFLLYAAQFVWTIAGALIFLVGDRQALRALEEAEGILPPPPPGEKLTPSSTVR